MPQLIRYVFAALIFLVPFTIIIADEVGSFSFFVLSISGIVYLFLPKGRCSIKEITTYEKLFFVVFVGYFLVACASYLFGDMATLGATKLGRYARFLLFIPLYLFFKELPPAHRIVLFGVTCGAIVAGLIAFNQVWWHFDLGFSPGIEPHTRASGSVNYIAFGSYAFLMAIVSIVASEYYFEQQKFFVLFPISGFVMGMIASALSGTKGSWIALPLMALCWYWLSRNTNSRKIRQLSIVLFSGVTVIIIYGVHYAYVNSDISKHYTYENSVLSRMERMFKEGVQLEETGTYNPNVGIGARLELWKAGWIAFKSSPLLGIGVGKFPEFANALVSEGMRAPIILKHNHLHNEYVMALAERGIVGFVALGAVFLIPFIKFVKVVNSPCRLLRMIGLQGALIVVAFMHFALTEAIFDRTLPITLYVFFIAVLLAEVFKIEISGFDPALPKYPN